MTVVPFSGALRRPRAWRWSPRNLIVPLALIALALVLTYAATRGAANATLDLQVRLVATSDPMNIGAATDATVEVRNRSDHEMRPRFSLSWLPYPYYWRIVSGPEVLRAGEAATYAIEAPDSTAAPHDGEPFQLKVNDATSITYAVSDTITREKRDLPVANPALRLWTERDPSTGLLAPAGWGVYQRKGDGDTTVVEDADVFGTPAVRFHVVQDGQPDPGGWAHTGLTQEVPFPSAPFQVDVLSQAPYTAVADGWPLTAFGIEVSDSANGLIWLLFQPTGNGDREYDLPSGHHIKVYDVKADTWSTVPVDLRAMYDRLGWTPSKTVTLKLFAAAASTQPADVQGYVRAVLPAGETGGGCQALAEQAVCTGTTSSTQATP